MDARSHEASGTDGSEELNTNESLSRLRFLSHKSRNRYFGSLLNKLVGEHSEFWTELKDGLWECAEWEESAWDGISAKDIEVPKIEGEHLIFEVKRASLDDTGKRLNIMFGEGGRRRSLDWTEYIPVLVTKPRKNPKRAPGLETLANFFTEILDEN